MPLFIFPLFSVITGVSMNFLVGITMVVWLCMSTLTELSVSEREDLKVVKTCTCSKCKSESVWIDVIKNNETFTIGGVYRHQGGNPAHFDAALEVTFNNIAKNETCVITGDMNINLLNIDGAITTDYISSVMSHGFIPYITRPTQITEYTATLIDHLFIKLPHHICIIISSR